MLANSETLLTTAQKQVEDLTAQLKSIQDQLTSSQEENASLS